MSLYIRLAKGTAYTKQLSDVQSYYFALKHAPRPLEIEARVEMSSFQIVDIVFFDELVVPENLVETINTKIASGICEQTTSVA